MSLLPSGSPTPSRDVSLSHGRLSPQFRCVFPVKAESAQQVGAAFSRAAELLRNP